MFDKTIKIKKYAYKKLNKNNLKQKIIISL